MMKQHSYEKPDFAIVTFESKQNIAFAWEQITTSDTDSFEYDVDGMIKLKE